MAIYESEHTKFIRAFLEQHPEEREEQKKSRALWWNRPQSLEEQRRATESRIAQKPYPYQTDL